MARSKRPTSVSSAVDGQHVPGCAGQQDRALRALRPVGLQRTAQARHVDPQRALLVGAGCLAPQLVEDAIGRQHRPGVDQQQPEQRPLPEGAQLDRHTVAFGLQPAQRPELDCHRASPFRSVPPGRGCSGRSSVALKSALSGGQRRPSRSPDGAGHAPRRCPAPALAGRRCRRARTPDGDPLRDHDRRGIGGVAPAGRLGHRAVPGRRPRAASAGDQRPRRPGPVRGQRRAVPPGADTRGPPVLVEPRRLAGGGAADPARAGVTPGPRPGSTRGSDGPCSSCEDSSRGSTRSGRRTSGAPSTRPSCCRGA